MTTGKCKVCASKGYVKRITDNGLEKVPCPECGGKDDKDILEIKDPVVKCHSYRGNDSGVSID